VELDSDGESVVRAIKSLPRYQIVDQDIQTLVCNVFMQEQQGRLEDATGGQVQPAKAASEKVIIEQGHLRRPASPPIFEIQVLSEFNSFDSRYTFALALWHVHQAQSKASATFRNTSTVDISELSLLIFKLKVVIRSLAIDSSILPNAFDTFEEAINKSNMLEMLYLTYICRIQRQLSFKDIWKLFTADRVPWAPSFEQIPAVDIVKEMQIQAEQEFLELTALYDPAGSDRFGMSDYFLLLKDLFLNEKKYHISLGQDSSSVFEEENSYKRFNKVLETLLFKVLGMNSEMYRNAKDFLFDKDTFWMILHVLVGKKLMFVKAVDNRIDKGTEADFDEEAKRMVRKIEELQNDERRLMEPIASNSQQRLSVSSKAANLSSEQSEVSLKSHCISNGSRFGSRVSSPRNLTRDFRQDCQQGACEEEKPKINIIISNSLRESQEAHQARTFNIKSSSSHRQPQTIPDISTWRQEIEHIFSYYCHSGVPLLKKEPNQIKTLRRSLQFMDMESLNRFLSDCCLLMPAKNSLIVSKNSDQPSDHEVLKKIFKQRAVSRLGIGFESFVSGFIKACTTIPYFDKSVRPKICIPDIAARPVLSFPASKSNRPSDAICKHPGEKQRLRLIRLKKLEPTSTQLNSQTQNGSPVTKESLQPVVSPNKGSLLGAPNRSLDHQPRRKSDLCDLLNHQHDIGSTNRGTSANLTSRHLSTDQQPENNDSSHIDIGINLIKNKQKMNWDTLEETRSNANWLSLKKPKFTRNSINPAEAVCSIERKEEFGTRKQDSFSPKSQHNHHSNRHSYFQQNIFEHPTTIQRQTDLHPNPSRHFDNRRLKPIDPGQQKKPKAGSSLIESRKEQYVTESVRKPKIESPLPDPSRARRIIREKQRKDQEVLGFALKRR
jgi:hypothetical protein